MPMRSSRLCRECSTVLEIERSIPFCPACGQSVARFEVHEGRCAWCRREGTRLSGTVRVGPYEQHLGHLVRAYKYAGREELEPLLGRWLAEAVARSPWFEKIEVVSTVPAHWWDRLRRPLHAAETLAKFVARRIDRPFVPLLRRRYPGRRQTGLTGIERRENVRGLFAPARAVTLQKARVLLVDDVKTTGATLEQCAKILKRQGASEIYAAVIAARDWQNP
ncbi:MAG: ComF family protein [Phycisphaerales bacterium]|nr:MAG: ComF family protein [Phycisphaerales bacterium]